MTEIYGLASAIKKGFRLSKDPEFYDTVRVTEDIVVFNCPPENSSVWDFFPNICDSTRKHAMEFGMVIHARPEIPLSEADASWNPVQCHPRRYCMSFTMLILLTLEEDEQMRAIALYYAYMAERGFRVYLEENIPFRIKTKLGKNRTPNPTASGGKKDDAGKLQAGALFSIAQPLLAVCAVLSFGAEKYDRESWKDVPNARQRYTDALYRHQLARESGQVYDPETGLPHRAHEITNSLFLLWFDIKDGIVKNFTTYNKPEKHDD